MMDSTNKQTNKQKTAETFTSSVTDRFKEKHKVRLHAARQALLSVDAEGHTPLHCACQGDPPVRAVMVLLTAASVAAAASGGDTTHRINHNEQPEDDDHQPIQLHLLCAHDGSTALQTACACGASLAVLEVLLNPPAGLLPGAGLVHAVDRQGHSPLTELVVHYTLEQKRSPRFFNILPLEQIQLVDDETVSHEFDLFWCKVEALIRAAWLAHPIGSHPLGDSVDRRNHASSPSFISILHGAAHVACSIPAVLADLICRGYPHMVSFTDRSVWLPLHLTICSCCHIECCSGLSTCGDSGGDSHRGKNRSNSSLSFERKQQQHHHHPFVLERQMALMATLLHRYPAAARSSFPDTKRSTLCTAIVNGMQWHYSSILSMEEDGPLKLLYQYCPALGSERDTLTGLFPFALAATHMTTFGVATDFPGSVQDALELDTIYNLLRIYPQLLQDSFTSS